jgi:Methylase of chemotaxis methyl-accepting proteins
MLVSNQIPETEEDKLTQSIEIKLLLEAIRLKYGYDFRDYTKAHLKRRLLNRMKRSQFKTMAEMQHQLLYNEDFFHTLLVDLSLNVTEMFRDPLFFEAVREQAVPVLKTYPYLKIWHAGCATGEEVYSMAILLKEEGLLDRCTIYATDFNQIALQKAIEGIYPVSKIREYVANYNKAKGKASLTDYFTVQYDNAMVDKSVKKNIVFSDHNLVTDGVFGEMNMIVCRNVLIYFNRELQNKVIQLFFNSLLPGGLLCLGTKETIMFSDYREHFKLLHKLNLFKKSY